MATPGHQARSYPTTGSSEARTSGASLSGPFGSGVKNMPIPATIVDKKHWHDLFDVELRAGISGYEDLARSDEGSFTEKWPAHYTQFYSQEPITENGMHLIDAWKIIPKGAIVNLLSTVRRPKSWTWRLKSSG